MRDYFQRQKSKLRLWRSLGDQINRRAAVESYLIQCYEGKKPLPDAAKCKELALKLGVPGN
jgi:hypothetical protein